MLWFFFTQMPKRQREEVEEARKKRKEDINGNIRRKVNVGQKWRKWCWEVSLGDFGIEAILHQFIQNLQEWGEPSPKCLCVAFKDQHKGVGVSYQVHWKREEERKQEWIQASAHFNNPQNQGGITTQAWTIGLQNNLKITPQCARCNERLKLLKIEDAVAANPPPTYCANRGPPYCAEAEALFNLKRRSSTPA